ncbi:hypothetical protein FA15DRAFT_638678 [Coprinopsis marcescibilis]|uniref:Uncharacterized protein n=1 Tax=Coprinopsis marcescibilis TaxID=230819 RepID=A0A5C3L063_COPMA|nr:hypothetical protein FA15DRAFT_638678 [Coprinopsis marcescibilis]
MRFTFTFLLTPAILSLHAAAQRGCEGAVGVLYDGSANCDPATRAAACTWMVPRSCCRKLFHSGSMSHFSDLPEGPAAWAIAPALNALVCGEASRTSRVDPGCLSHDGAKTVYGVFWAFCHDDFKNAPLCRQSAVAKDLSSAPTRPSECDRAVLPDVFYLYDGEGKEAKPYSERVVMFLDQAEAVDWDTRRIKADKMDVFRSVAAVHGDGLNGMQLNALQKLDEDDARRGFLPLKW